MKPFYKVYILTCLTICRFNCHWYLSPNSHDTRYETGSTDTWEKHQCSGLQQDFSPSPHYLLSVNTEGECKLSSEIVLATNWNSLRLLFILFVCLLKIIDRALRWVISVYYSKCLFCDYSYAQILLGSGSHDKQDIFSSTAFFCQKTTLLTALQLLGRLSKVSEALDLVRIYFLWPHFDSPVLWWTVSRVVKVRWPLNISKGKFKMPRCQNVHPVHNSCKHNYTLFRRHIWWASPQI